MENTTNSVKREKDNLGNKISLGVEIGKTVLRRISNAEDAGKIRSIHSFR